MAAPLHPQEVLAAVMDRSDLSAEEREAACEEMLLAVVSVLVAEMPDQGEIRRMCGGTCGPPVAPDPAFGTEDA